MTEQPDLESMPADAAPRVLLIEDDEADYLLTRDLLADVFGSAVVLDWARTWQDALATIGEARHDVYLVDYRLGERNGLELVREAVDLGSAAPFILLTGQGSREIDLKAMRAGGKFDLVRGEAPVRQIPAIRPERDQVIIQAQFVALIGTDVQKESRGLGELKFISEEQDRFLSLRHFGMPDPGGLFDFIQSSDVRIERQLSRRDRDPPDLERWRRARARVLEILRPETA